MRVAQALKIGVIRFEAVKVTLFRCKIAVAPGQVALNGVTLDALAHDVYRFKTHALEIVYPPVTQHRLKLLNVVPDAPNQLPAVAAAGAPADAMGFQ